jgi:hypothetical protein
MNSFTICYSICLVIHKRHPKSNHSDINCYMTPSATIISFYFLSFNFPCLSPHSVLKVFPSPVIARPSPPAFPPTPPISSILSSFHLKLFPWRHHLPPLQIFNACKLFSHNLYPANDDERTCINEEWLERLFFKF